MIPVAGLDDVRIAWVVLQKQGFILYGFLLYTDADREVVDYMRDGIFDLDALSGDECAIFVIESPSENWISYSKQQNHTWWQLFGERLAERALADMPPDQKSNKAWHVKFTLFQKTIIENNNNANVVVGDDNTVTLAHIIQPRISLLYNRSEALKVAPYFGVNPDELPCLIFFKDLHGSVVTKKPLEDCETQSSLKKFFRTFFGSEDFKAMLVATT
jgi:hypothetical protein